MLMIHMSTQHNGMYTHIKLGTVLDFELVDVHVRCGHHVRRIHDQLSLTTSHKYALSFIYVVRNIGFVIRLYIYCKIIIVFVLIV